MRVSSMPPFLPVPPQAVSMPAPPPEPCAFCPFPRRRFMKPERGTFPCFWSSRNSRPNFPMSRSPCRLPSAPCRFTSIPACAGMSSCSAKGRVRYFRAKVRFPSVRCCLRIRARFSPRRFRRRLPARRVAAVCLALSGGQALFSKPACADRTGGAGHPLLPRSAPAQALFAARRRT